MTDHLSALRTEANALREAAVTAGADADVPTCPGWQVSRLVGHVGRVYEMAALAVRSGPEAGPPTTQRPPADWDGILDYFDERLAGLLDTLTGADPTAPAWIFTPTAAPTVAFWHRRMAHETTVHRIDTQLAAGEPDGVEAEFAADGVDEVLTRLIQRRPEWAESELRGTVVYRATDVPRGWTVRLAPGELPQTSPDASPEPSATVSGTAHELYLAVWGRPNAASTSGDRALLDAARTR